MYINHVFTLQSKIYFTFQSQSILHSESNVDWLSAILETQQQQFEQIWIIQISKGVIILHSFVWFPTCMLPSLDGNLARMWYHKTRTTFHRLCTDLHNLKICLDSKKDQLIKFNNKCMHNHLNPILKQLTYLSLKVLGRCIFMKKWNFVKFVYSSTRVVLFWGKSKMYIKVTPDVKISSWIYDAIYGIRKPNSQSLKFHKRKVVYANLCKFLVPKLHLNGKTNVTLYTVYVWDISEKLCKIKTKLVRFDQGPGGYDPQHQHCNSTCIWRKVLWII